MIRLIVVLLVINNFVVHAQQGGVIPPNVRATNTIERLTDSNGLGNNEMLYGIPLPEGKVIGDTYLNTEWQKSVILLYEGNKLLEGYLIRYDIKIDELDVKTASSVKVLSGKNVKSFMWMAAAGGDAQYFINAKEFRDDGIPLIGFFEVLVDGNTPLFKKTNVSIKKADYNVTLSMGSRDDKILKSSTYFLVDGNKVYELPGNKKKFLALFKGKASEIEGYMDANDLSVKKEEELVLIFKYCNSLTNN
jgi:hypothetical protein